MKKIQFHLCLKLVPTEKQHHETKSVASQGLNKKIHQNLKKNIGNKPGLKDFFVLVVIT